jgi:hypothetical protein
MRIYRITDIGESEASSPVANPSPSMRVLYYLRRRNNRAASDDMVIDNVFGGDRGQAHAAINRLLRAKAIASIGS